MSPLKDRLPVALVNACSPWAWTIVGGITPVARLCYSLREAGVTDVVVLVTDGRRAEGLPKWGGTYRVRVLGKDAPLSSMAPEELASDTDVLYADARYIIDPRLIGALIDSAVTVSLSAAAENASTDRRTPAILVKAADVPIWRRAGTRAVVINSKRLTPDDVDPYFPPIRGNLTPYAVKVTDRSSARRATGLLVRSQQKRVMDLPARYLDPFFENWVTRLLCNTPVTPDMVTLANLAVAIVVAILFWHGFFVGGALLMFVVEILDGVDGKLARTKLMFSRMGEHEDFIDYLYENSWYVALAVGLGRSFPGSAGVPAILAAILIVSDTLDNVFYNLSGRWFCKSLDLMHRLDGAFRLVAGRRNIYGLIFLIGFVAGYPLHAFALAAFWGSVTATVHGARLLQLRVARYRSVGSR